MKARGTRIRRLREEAGIGLNAFARRVGISPSWLSRIETHQAGTPSPEVLSRIATALGVDIPKIARHEGGSDEDPAPPGPAGDDPHRSRQVHRPVA
ncbi:helix-turn-helix transcriptional regulator [Streptomyces sp. CAI-21]|nr:helix-turn-helix transcriptional regulator [Streptomyces sp. CAI-21]